MVAKVALHLGREGGGRDVLPCCEVFHCMSGRELPPALMKKPVSHAHTDHLSS